MRMEIYWKGNGRTIINVKVIEIFKEIVARDILFLLFSFDFPKKGKFSFIDGETYEGGWKDGLMEGIGNLIEQNLILEFLEISHFFISLEKANTPTIMEMCMKGTS